MAKKVMLAGLALVVGAFALVALHARQVSLGYRLAQTRSRHAELSREVERLRFTYASKASPVQVMRQAKKMGLDLRPSVASPGAAPACAGAQTGLRP